MAYAIDTAYGAIYNIIASPNGSRADAVIAGPLASVASQD